MFFSFKLKKIKCNSVLSSDDGWWGDNDGIRVFFIAVNASGFRQLFISGPEHPPPSLNENYYFFAGHEKDLSAFPPRNAPDWETDPVDVGETDTMSIAVIGLNEGLPYIAGGGGGWSTGPAISGIEEVSKKMAEEAFKEGSKVAAGATTLGIMSAAFKILENYIEELNQAEDCRGVAFAFEVSLSMKRLFQDHLSAKLSSILLNEASAANALHIVALSRVSSDCGNPDYDAWMEVKRLQHFDLIVNDKPAHAVAGTPVPFQASIGICIPAGSEIQVWTEYYDREITIEPTIPKYSTLHPTWVVEGVMLPDVGSGPLTFTKQVEIPISEATELHAVQIEYEVMTIGGAYHLRLKTRGIDANYTLKVALMYKFDDNGPWVLFREKDVAVAGQGIAGNQAYIDYLACLEHQRKTFMKYVRIHDLIVPGAPLRKITQFERDHMLMRRLMDGQGLGTRSDSTSE